MSTNEQHNELLQRVNALHERFDRLEKHLFGNGKPGIRERVGIIESRLEVATEQAKASKAAMWAAMIALAAVVAQFVFDHLQRGPS